MSKPAKPTKYISFPCLKVTQGGTTLALLSIKAKELWRIVKINLREPDKETGYQRVLSNARVNSVSRYVKAGNPIPTSILISFDDAKFSSNDSRLVVPDRTDAGWVIDGQHRLAGVHQSEANIELSVVAFLNLPEQKQIEQFVKINREAKNVPTSLYLDLLKHLPDKTDAERSKERASDIATVLRKDEESPFFGRISIIGSPKPGQISLTNFVRKVGSLVAFGKGKLHVYSATEQIAIVDNYYKAIEHSFPNFFEPSKGTSVFFKTVGFGAVFNVLPTVFDLCLKHHKSFKVQDIVKILKLADDYDFANWDSYGSGSEAEIALGDDLRERIVERATEGEGEEGTTLSL